VVSKLSETKANIHQEGNKEAGGDAPTEEVTKAKDAVVAGKQALRETT